ncbi:MAG: hypothetical protein GX664_04060 [Bacteroidales bacterium]|nr:hypothetical protein [Bacteroidales bacterium]
MSKQKKVWDNCKFIGEVKKSERTKLRVELVARDGVRYINVREWYMKKSEGIWKPGLSGFAIPVKIPIEGQVVQPAEELIKLMQKVIEEAPSFPLEDEANAVWRVKE